MNTFNVHDHSTLDEFIIVLADFYFSSRCLLNRSYSYEAGTATEL